MNRWVLPIVAVLVFGNAIAHAQIVQATQPTQVVAPTRGQNSAADPSMPQTSEKKVWTNEDLSALDTREGISTDGSATENTAKHAVPAKSHDPKWYQDQIAKLQAKIPPLDSQIADLQAALGGKPTGDAKKSVRPVGVKAGDWSRELAELQKKRDDTLTQIVAIRDQARHNGVAPNALP